MKKILIVFISIFCFFSLFAQDNKHIDKAKKSPQKISGLDDRAGGTHNASNIGLFFENRGKLYPRRITQGPSGEFPINSAKHYIYRINPMVGVPGNVVQARYTDNEEWEAAYGYHNRDSAQIAFSDNPVTWHPQLGWPVKDSNGDPLIISDQDSYAVYNDSNNTKNVLGIEVHQIGYAYGVNFVKNIIFFTYKIINKGNSNLSGVYFNMYTDMDIGNISGGVPEYGDDRIDFNKEKQLVYFYDDGVSPEWPGGKTGFMGVTFLSTPEMNGVQLGITDMHYNLYEDDIDNDTIQYGILSSSQGLYNSSLSGKYFHIGNNTNIHFDDPSTIPASGIDLAANISSGPYQLNIGDTITFVTALVAGETLAELFEYTDQARNTVAANFELPEPPMRPHLSGEAADKKVILLWDDASEYSLDKFTGYDFEGYRLYRSRDKGITWKKIADFDVINSIGNNTGLQYSYVDTSVINGFEYWYTITAYDRGTGNIESLESAFGNTLEAVNTISKTPLSTAIGRDPVSTEFVQHTGDGKSNYILSADPLDRESLAGGEYKVGFTYTSRIESGDLATKVSINITDSLNAITDKVGIKFTSSTQLDVLNLTDNTIIRSGYPYIAGGRSVPVTGGGMTIVLKDEPNTAPEFLPEEGDLITINFSLFAVKNNSDTVIKPRPYSARLPQSTSDGIILNIFPPDYIKSVSRVGGTDNIDLTFSVDDETVIKNNLYIVKVEGNGFDSDNKGFVKLSISDTALIKNIDTLYSLSTFTFEGIEGRISFNSSAPPAAGNIFSVETVNPIKLSVKDEYIFRIKGSAVNQKNVAESLNKIKVVPNPYVVSSLYEPEFGELRREPLRQIQFINLPAECTIYIFSVNADLVKTIDHNSTNGTAVWDLRSESGREIAPGVYIYVVKTTGSEYIERFAVIK